MVSSKPNIIFPEYWEKIAFERPELNNKDLWTYQYPEERIPRTVLRGLIKNYLPRNPKEDFREYLFLPLILEERIDNKIETEYSLNFYETMASSESTDPGFGSAILVEHPRITPRKSKQGGLYLFAFLPGFRLEQMIKNKISPLWNGQLERVLDRQEINPKIPGWKTESYQLKTIPQFRPIDFPKISQIKLVREFERIKERNLRKKMSRNKKPEYEAYDPDKDWENF